MLVIQKYGGSSLATPKQIQNAAQRIADLRKSGSQVVVVASAMGRMTDHLLRLAEKTVKVPPPREIDMLLTAGERISMSLLSMALQELGVAAISFTGSQSGIITTDDHTDAKIIDIRPYRICEELALGKVVIIGGFQGVSEKKEITTLGRGGSDTTAVALAAVLQADRCEILTDVNGLYSADPRLVPEARILTSLDYESALELASLGAKMQARSIELAKKFNVNIRISSSSSQTTEGTQIPLSLKKSGTAIEQIKVTGVATKDGFHFFKTQSEMVTLLKALKNIPVPLRFLSHQKTGVYFLIEKEQVVLVRQILTEQNINFEETQNTAIVSVLGESLTHSIEFFTSVFSQIEMEKIDLLFSTSNAISVTFGVGAQHKELLARFIHKTFITSKD